MTVVQIEQTMFTQAEHSQTFSTKVTALEDTQIHTQLQNMEAMFFYRWQTDRMSNEPERIQNSLLYFQPC